MSLEAKLVDLGDLAPLAGPEPNDGPGSGCGFGDCLGYDLSLIHI